MNHIWKLGFVALAALFLGSCDENSSKTEEASTLSFDNRLLHFTTEGGDVEIAVTSNTDWAIEGAEDYDWFILDPTSGSGDATLYLSVDPNYTYTTNSAVLTAQTADEAVTVNLVISQEAIEVEETTSKNEDGSYIYSTSVKASQITEAGYSSNWISIITIGGSVAPTVTCESEEVTIAEEYDMNDELDTQVAPANSVEYDFYFSVAENTEQVQKEYILVVTFGDIVKEVKITQDAYYPGEDLQVLETEYNSLFSKNGVESNVPLSGKYLLKEFELDNETVSLYADVISGTIQWKYMLSAYSFRCEADSKFALVLESTAEKVGSVARIKICNASEVSTSVLTPSTGSIASGADASIYFQGQTKYFYILNWVGSVQGDEGVEFTVSSSGAYTPRGFIVKYQPAEE